MWRRKFESHRTFFSKPNKTYNYQYCKWWLYIISNHPQQSAVQNNLISATHFGDGPDLRRSPLMWLNTSVEAYRSRIFEVTWNLVMVGSLPSDKGWEVIRVVDCPTRWSLWYWYLDFYVDHLYFDTQITKKYSTAMCYFLAIKSHLVKLNLLKNS